MISFKKNIKSIFFIIGLIILLCASSAAISPKEGLVYDIISVREKLYDLSRENPGTIDVLFAGDSLVFRDISPLRIWSLTGITSYDLSSGAMRICDQNVLIKKVCKKQQPKLIVLEADSMTKEASPFKDDFAIPTNIIERLFPIFHYHIFYKARDPFISGDNPSITFKGYDPSKEIQPYEGNTDYMSLSADPVEIGILNQKYFEDIIDFCKKNDIKLLLLALPSPVNYNSETHKTLRKMAEDHDLVFLDMNLIQKDIGIDWNTDTKDGGDHLNQAGADKVSSYLAKYIEENYTLTDKRNDISYDGWNRDYDKLYN